MRTFLRTALFVTSFLCPTTPASASQEHALAGRVRDEQGAAIPGAEVRASGPDGRPVTGISDATGNFILRVPAGPITVSATRAGFESRTIEMTVEKEASSLEIVLKLATRRESVTVQEPFGLRTATRLAAPRFTRVLQVVDGERWNGTRGMTNVPTSVLDPGSYESSDLVSGGGSASFGSDTGRGALSIVTRPPRRPSEGSLLSLRGNLTWRDNGNDARGRLSLEYATPRFAFRLSESVFDYGAGKAGDGSIDRSEVLKYAQLATEMGNAIENNAARDFPVFGLTAPVERYNETGRGWYNLAEAFYFPAPKQTLRFRLATAREDDETSAFTGPPAYSRIVGHPFTDMERYSASYEGRDTAPWLLRLSAGVYYRHVATPERIDYHNVEGGSSWVQSGAGQSLTGRDSTFSLGFRDDNLITSRMWGAHLEADFKSWERGTLQGGVQFMRDRTDDQMERLQYGAGGRVVSRLQGVAGSPDTWYQTLGAFVEASHSFSTRLRASGGLRVDNWKTRGEPTSRFPLARDLAVLRLAWPQIVARPGDVDPRQLERVLNLKPQDSLGSSNESAVTGNLGIAYQNASGFSAKARLSTGFIAQAITQRYIFRNFGTPGTSVLITPNVDVKPETSRMIEVQAALQRSRFNVSLVVFHDRLKNIARTTAASPTYSVVPDASLGLDPAYPGGPHHVVFVSPRNTEKSEQWGFESAVEGSFVIGTLGKLRPTATAAWVRGSYKTPSPNELTLVRRFYNRSDTAIPLEGSEDDIPMGGLRPFVGTAALQFTSPKEAWSATWQVRHQPRIKRVDPLWIAVANLASYSTFAGLSPITVHSARVSYRSPRKWGSWSANLALDNVSDRLYFEQYGRSVALGRSASLGVSFAWGRSFAGSGGTSRP